MYTHVCAHISLFAEGIQQEWKCVWYSKLYLSVFPWFVTFGTYVCKKVRWGLNARCRVWNRNAFIFCSVPYLTEGRRSERDVTQAVNTLSRALHMDITPVCSLFPMWRLTDGWLPKVFTHKVYLKKALKKRQFFFSLSLSHLLKSSDSPLTKFGALPQRDQ